MSTPLNPHPASKQKIDAVRCAACGRLHAFIAPTWNVLYGSWSRGQQPDRKPFVGKTFGKMDDPIVVCDQDDCILKAMGREEDD